MASYIDCRTAGFRLMQNFRLPANGHATRQPIRLSQNQQARRPDHCFTCPRNADQACIVAGWLDRRLAVRIEFDPERTHYLYLAMLLWTLKDGFYAQRSLILSDGYGSSQQKGYKQQE